ncbi:MAG: hypothetical protein KKC46_13670 [Proteobacteria bacterium]|nr:hypothetical protein [Pseudomonadota bacterium]
MEKLNWFTMEHKNGVKTLFVTKSDKMETLIYSHDYQHNGPRSLENDTESLERGAHPIAESWSGNNLKKINSIF